MSNKKKIYTFLFLFLVLICLFGFIWSYKVTKQVRQSAAEGGKNQVVTVKNLILTETKDENIYWELYAEKGSYQSALGDVVLTNATGNFYNSDGEVVLSFESCEGTYNETTQNIALKGDTLIVAKDGSSIRADEILWQGKDEDIKAKGNVVVKRDEDFISYAENARFNSELTFFEISGKTKTNVYSKDGKSATKGLLN